MPPHTASGIDSPPNTLCLSTYSFQGRNLPIELILYIFQLAAENSLAGCRSLSLVCSWSRRQVLPFMIRSVFLSNNDKVESFFTFIRENRALAQHIRSFCVFGPTRSTLGYSFEHCMEAYPNLELTIVPCTYIERWNGLELPRVPRLGIIIPPMGSNEAIRHAQISMLLLLLWRTVLPSLEKRREINELLLITFRSRHADDAEIYCQKQNFKELHEQDPRLIWVTLDDENPKENFRQFWDGGSFWQIAQRFHKLVLKDDNVPGEFMKLGSRLRASA